MDGQGTQCRRNIAENLNRLSRAHERYRRQTDGRAITYSEREREFTFAKNYSDEQLSEISHRQRGPYMGSLTIMRYVNKLTYLITSVRTPLCDALSQHGLNQFRCIR